MEIRKSVIFALIMLMLISGCAGKISVSTQKTEEYKSSLCGRVIVVDAGHGKSSVRKKEAIAPGSSETKSAFVVGTTGKNQTEEQLNLAVALKLQERLSEEGVHVYMTRTDHNSTMTNIDRAELGNTVNADLSVKIHADGSLDKSVNGASMLIPGDKYISDAKVLENSRMAGEFILKNYVEQTGAKNNGIVERNDMTGFNWSKVPVVLLEAGFMTNPEEDKLMETEEYQNKMVEGIVLGITQYFESQVKQKGFSQEPYFISFLHN